MPCNLQTAIAGLNSCTEEYSCEVWLGEVVMKTGSRATEICEPRQVRKEAAVSKNFRVPRGSLVRANCPGIARKAIFEGRCAAIFI